MYEQVRQYYVICHTNVNIYNVWFLVKWQFFHSNISPWHINIFLLQHSSKDTNCATWAKIWLGQEILIWKGVYKKNIGKQNGVDLLLSVEKRQLDHIGNVCVHLPIYKPQVTTILKWATEIGNGTPKNCFHLTNLWHLLIMITMVLLFHKNAL